MLLPDTHSITGAAKRVLATLMRLRFPVSPEGRDAGWQLYAIDATRHSSPTSMTKTRLLRHPQHRPERRLEHRVHRAGDGRVLDEFQFGVTEDALRLLARRELPEIYRRHVP